MAVSTITRVDDAITTMTQSVDGVAFIYIPKSYFINSRGVLKLNDRENDPQ